MCDLRKRVGLIHKLRELTGTKKLAHRCRHRLGVDKIPWHGRLHFLMDRHLLLDRAFHALKADAKLVFQQLSNRPDTPVAEMIDIVGLILRRVLAHLQHVRNHLVKVFRRQQRIVYTIALRFAHLDVELQPAHAGEIKLARIEEHRFEQLVGSLNSWRIAGTHLPVNFQKRIDRFGDDILLQRLRENGTDIIALREKDRETVNSAFNDLLQLGWGDLIVGFEDYLATLFVDDIGNGVGAVELRNLYLNLTDV